MSGANKRPKPPDDWAGVDEVAEQGSQTAGSARAISFLQLLDFEKTGVPLRDWCGWVCQKRKSCITAVVYIYELFWGRMQDLNERKGG